jgi:hypothetical protein
MGASVPIYRLLSKEEAFPPELVVMLGLVFEDVLKTLGPVDRDDPLAKLVAIKVIELAQIGERNPARVKQLTLLAFQQRPD